MWTNGDDFNDEGDRVRLYQPIAYSSGRSLSQDDPTVSYVGGSTTAVSTAYCATCHASMEKLVQLHIPSRQTTYHVLGCNQAKCVNGLFNGDSNSKFSMGGGGVFYGQRMEAKEETKAAAPVPTVIVSAPTPAPHKEKEEETNDWMVDSDDDDDDADLEQQVAAVELKQKKSTTNDSSTNHKSRPSQKKKSNHNNNNKSTKAASSSSFSWPCFELHSVLEPPGKPKQSIGEDDDDDEEDRIGSGGTNSSTSDAKIQQLLAKYMAEEEDEDILAALRGTSAGGGGGGGKSREKDERLKASDRALLTFTDRIKRSPRQVLRYAPNGIPLWSM